MDATDLELQRAMEAVRRGWVPADDVKRLIDHRSSTGTLLATLQELGKLTAEQVGDLYAATIAVGTPPRPPHADEEVLNPGDFIAGRYLVERTLRGGFARVYICVDATSGKHVALKTPLREHLANETVLEMFRAEVLQWIQLGNHPNIVLAYGLEEFMRLPFIVMEYVEGRPLSQALRDRTSGWQRALDFGLQIALALEHAGRACRLVHRDLKPQNVLLTRAGTAKVTDFGLSVVRRVSDDAVVGTPPYMPPEQWIKPRAVDVRSDVYAFGVMLYEMAAGRRPFPEHHDVEDYRDDHVRRPPIPPQMLARDIPAGLAALVLRCLAKEQHNRPADFEAVVAEMRELAGGLHAARPAAPTPNVVDGLVNQSRTYQLLGRPDEALRTAREAVARDPASVDAQIALGHAHGLRREYDDAIRCFARAHRLDSLHPTPLVNLARHYFLADNRLQAESWLDRALMLAPPELLEGVTDLLLEFDRPRIALLVCDRILARDPKAVIAWNNRALALRRVGDLRGALESVTRAVELNPRYAKGWSNRATFLLQEGRPAEAIEAADTALTYDPRIGGAYVAKASALRHLGRAAESTACVREGLKALPEHAALQRMLK